MKVQPPSRKLTAINDALSKMPLKPLPVEKVRAQVIQHLLEAKSEILRSGRAVKVRWYRPSDGSVIIDAKSDNFIKTPAGLIPIDLQMAQFSPKQLKAADLSSDASAPIIFIPR